MAGGSRSPAERSYGRLTKPERNNIDCRLDRGDSYREIARSPGRVPFTVCLVNSF